MQHQAGNTRKPEGHTFEYVLSIAEDKMGVSG
jgi:hypothetical protein